MRELTHLDLFSGICGFALAAQRAGFRTVGFSEIDPYACKVIAKLYPGIPNLGDVRTRESFAGLRGRITAISAGYPCQPESHAGKRKGTADHRWLWPATLDVLEAVRPTWFIGENVLGHVSLGLDQVLSDLEHAGYAAQPFVIPACAVGAWHRRDRVWIVAHLDGGLCDGGADQPERRKEGRTASDGNVEGYGLAAHADSLGQQQQDGSREEVGGRLEHAHEGADADLAGRGREGRDLQEAPGRAEPAVVPADPDGGGCGAGSILQRQQAQPGDAAPDGGLRGGADRRWDASPHFEWPAEPPLVRVVHGIPNRAHRIKALGNSIVPEVAEPFFHWIRQIETGELISL